MRHVILPTVLPLLLAMTTASAGEKSDLAFRLASRNPAVSPHVAANAGQTSAHADLFLCVLDGAEENQIGETPAGQFREYDDVHELLKAGREARSLPPDVVLRVEADLWKFIPADAKKRAEAEARDIDLHKKLQETWEFTSNHVHRVVVEVSEKSANKVVYRRVKSLPFNSKTLCKDLLDGKIYVIEADEGTGEPRLFAGTNYDFGHRTIEILVDGKSAFLLGESCVGAGYAETDARAFAAIYERLATQARAAFQAKPAP